METPDTAPDKVTLRDLYNMADAAREDVQQVKRDIQFSVEQGHIALNQRLDVQSGRMDDLIKTTNHRLDSFNSAMALRKIEVDTDLNRLKGAGGIKASEVAEVLIAQILRSRLAWALTIAFLLGGAPVLVDHWHELFDRIIALF